MPEQPKQRGVPKPARFPGATRYSVNEFSHGGGKTVTYEVKTGRNGRTHAFRLVLEGTAHNVADLWPLRREIARHAGVDPDRVIPDWDADIHRRTFGRLAPCAWFALTGPDEPPPGRVRTTIDEPGTY